MQYSSLERFILFFFILFSLFLFLNKFITNNKGVLSEQTSDNSLKETVENSLKESQGTYAVAIKNLKNGDAYYSNEHQIFEAGSLYKLWIMAETYEKSQNIKLTEVVILC
ncbi:MAG: hypothetical protein Q8Q91_01175, partial [Candidatus Daviesbacteria bacterium]|nr:hypothetical protein [Candidatus Daviesbacteria bacterium]